MSLTVLDYFLSREAELSLNMNEILLRNKLLGCKEVLSVIKTFNHGRTKDFSQHKLILYPVNLFVPPGIREKITIHIYKNIIT